MDDKSDSFNFIINKIMRIAKSASSKNEKLLNISKTLKNDVPNYDWVGFYFADEQTSELILGPFYGALTEHIKIKFGSGICGQAAETKETFVVQDVSKETNYLSCSPKVKSEIVVPILKNNRIVAELDIDSHTKEIFTNEDREFLENVANIVANLFSVP